MTAITVKKLTESHIILEDGSVEDYKPFSRIGENLTICTGYAVMIDGKVSKSSDSRWNVFPLKAAAIEQARIYKVKFD